MTSVSIVGWRVLSGPAILRISVLLIVAGVLAAMVQLLLPATAPAPAVPPPDTEAPTEPALASPQTPPAVPEQPPPAPAPQRRADGPTQMPADALAFPPAAATPAPAARQAAAEVVQAADTAGPRAVALVDLNTASVADLNRLQGGGTIGRAIVSKRPYTSVDQLMTKRVLSRAVYDRIREQVTVR